MKQQIYIYFIIISVFFINTSVIAQHNFNKIDSNSFAHWDVGADFGVYFPSKYNAQFYNGNSTNINNVNYIFGNEYWYQDIMYNLNASDTVFVKELPKNMHYKPAFQVGIYFRRTFKNFSGLSIQFDYSKLVTTDKYTVEVDPNIIATLHDIRIYDIWGIEERSNIDIIYSKYFPLKNKNIIPFFEGGLNISSTKVIENEITVGTLKYSLIDVYMGQSYIPNSPITAYDIREGGIGYGFSVAAGTQFQINEKFKIEPGIRLYFQKINLEHYDLLKPNFSIFIRLSLGSLFANNY